MVAAATAGCLLASDYVTGISFHDPEYYSRHGWPKLAAFWTAAAITQFLLPRNEESLPGATDISPRKSVLRERDGLFFLPIKYWPIVLFAAGILFYFIRD